MTKVLAVILIFTMACGTVLNSGPSTIVPPPGGTVDGSPAPIIASKKRPHEVVYPDGRRCIIESNVSAGYVIVDILVLFLVGVIVDAATGDWKVLDADSCPGVIVN